jgi:C4-dicarboxylate-specific signal transduction histidine kinase
MFDLKLDLDPSVPLVRVNEFTVWQILEPLIQNSIDHCGMSYVTIQIQTRYDRRENVSYIAISDNGKGILPELLDQGPKGVQRVFLEDETTKTKFETHSGYGCYIAHQLAVGKCGWQLSAENLPEGGCRFALAIRNKEDV